MKRIAILTFGFLLVLSNYAVELHPEEECNVLKTNLTAQVLELQQENADLRFNNSYILTSRLPLFYTAIEAGRQNDMAGDNIGDFNQLYNIANGISNASYQTSLTLEAQYNQIQSIFSAISSVDCSTCPSSSTNCCDFTEIIEAINDCLVTLEGIDSDLWYSVSVLEKLYTDYLQILQSNTNLLSQIDFDLKSIGSFTNILFKGTLQNPTLVASRKNVQATFYNNNQFLNGSVSMTSGPQNRAFSPTTYGLLNSTYSMLYNIWEMSASLSNGSVDFRLNYFPVLTNTVGAIRRDFSAYSDETTNFFSFFRGEIGVEGVLSDWQSEQVSGTYHDFLTNHYLSVVRGDSLSGNQSSKTNWFSRIETLLAALVFDGSSEINTVDSTTGEDERAELSSSLLSANQTASNFNQDFNTASQGIVDLYRSYFNTFDNAAMPSHVVLMKLSSDDSEDIEIAFQSDSLSILVEACRVVTTLCWSSVGIFLLYKFLVWSARCVIVACQFIYRAISSVFRS